MRWHDKYLSGPIDWCSHSPSWKSLLPRTEDSSCAPCVLACVAASSQRASSLCPGRGFAVWQQRKTVCFCGSQE